MDPKLEKLGNLLSGSMIDPDLKESLLENLPKMPVGYVDEIINILESEEDILEELEIEMLRFIKRQEDLWQEANQKQRQSIREIMDEALKNITPRNLSVNRGQ